MRLKKKMGKRCKSKQRRRKFVIKLQHKLQGKRKKLLLKNAVAAKPVSQPAPTPVAEPEQNTAAA